MFVRIYIISLSHDPDDDDGFLFSKCNAIYNKKYIKSYQPTTVDIGHKEISQVSNQHEFLPRCTCTFKNHIVQVYSI